MGLGAPLEAGSPKDIRDLITFFNCFERGEWTTYVVRAVEIRPLKVFDEQKKTESCDRSNPTA